MATRAKTRHPPVSTSESERPVLKDPLLSDLELRLSIAARKIADLSRVRDELERSRDSMIALYEQSPVGYMTLDARGHVRNANASAARLLGMRRERLLQLPFNLLVHPEDRSRLDEHLSRCQRRGAVRVRTGLRMKTKRGRNETHFAQVEMISGRFLDKTGELVFLTALVDLSERELRNEELVRARESSERIIETVRHPLAVVDHQLKIVRVNLAFTEYFKRSASHVQGRALDSVLNLWWSGNQLRVELEKALFRNERIEDLKLRINPSDVGERIVLLSARRLHQHAEGPALALVALEDITEREIAREEVRLLNEQLEQRVAARTEALQKSYEQMEAFCYSIAHDLRAPLRAMAGFSRILSDQFGDVIGAEALNYVKRIEGSAERMDMLIRDLLDYGRLNTIRLERSTVDLDMLFADVLMEMDNEIQARGARIRKEGVLPSVCGNMVVLRVVLGNLLSNAMKFVAPGTNPEVLVRCDNAPGTVRVWVIDNGIGISPEYHQKIFGVFQRLHSSETYPGTGIGLALVSKGVERLGGRVGVESEPGRGCRFWIELQQPAGAAESSLQPVNA